jgi:radical SAM protein with 4Fe4S-binding SPASM domain
MEDSLFRKLVDDCTSRWQLLELHLHGFGEPLLDNHLAEKVAYAKSRCIRTVYIVTTGAMLTRERGTRLIEAGLDAIKFSFYGATPTSYEQVHNGLKFHSTIQNIRQFIDLRRQMCSMTPRITIQFMPQPENQHETPAFRSLWAGRIDAALGDRLMITQRHNYGGGRDYTRVDPESDFVPCRFPFEILHVTADGTVVCCSHDINKELVLGNARERSIESIWNGKEFMRFRKAHRRKNLSVFPFCQRCDFIRMKWSS